MSIAKTFTFAAVSALALTACGGSGGSSSGTRDFVRGVGSSTVYPFATAVAEARNRRLSNRPARAPG